MSANIEHASCYQCGYPLKGLPSQHSCPECGWLFTEETGDLVVCRMGATQPYVWTIMVFLFLGSPLVLVTILSHAFRLIGPSKPELMFFAVLPIIGFLIPLGWVFRRVRYRQSEWIISGSGVLIRDIGDRFVPWHQVEAVFYGPDFVRILLIRRTASLRSPPFFHNRAEAARIANEMDARRIQAVAADPTRIRPPTAFRHD